MEVRVKTGLTLTTNQGYSRNYNLVPGTYNLVDEDAKKIIEKYADVVDNTPIKEERKEKTEQTPKKRGGRIKV